MCRLKVAFDNISIHIVLISLEFKQKRYLIYFYVTKWSIKIKIQEISWDRLY